jgi:hypothetical protein|tara:strand:- start:622 stop:813 length:192 start_codon:yes stop_codon:yes gene_type:complete
MIYKLINRTTGEVIDRVDVRDQDPTEFFMERKKLDSESFKNLFHVQSDSYQWWEEESTKLDDF